MFALRFLLHNTKTLAFLRRSKTIFYWNLKPNQKWLHSPLHKNMYIPTLRYARKLTLICSIFEDGTKLKIQYTNWHLSTFTIDRVKILSHCYSIRSNLKEMGPLQFCLPVFLRIHRNPKQKEFFNSCEGFLR